MAASWNPKLIEDAQTIAAKEARASGIHWTFGPMVDIARDARWGRMVEGAGEDPFLDVQRYLRSIGVRVPDVVAFFQDDPQGGLMVLEDLGDDMLETRLRAGEDRAPLYEKAIDQLAMLRATAEQRPGGCVAFTRSFDADLYRWELEHFVEWGLEAWKGARLSPAERELCDREFDRIARTLEAEPKGFTHRDYQSRNIMVLPSGEQAVIDFQDALLGPREYDLVALLRALRRTRPEDPRQGRVRDEGLHFRARQRIAIPGARRAARRRGLERNQHQEPAKRASDPGAHAQV